MICPKCGSKKIVVVESGPHRKMICEDCLGFIKFLSKAEYKNWVACDSVTIKA